MPDVFNEGCLEIQYISINFVFTSIALQRSLFCLMCVSTALLKSLKQLFLIMEMHKHISI